MEAIAAPASGNSIRCLGVDAQPSARDRPSSEPPIPYGGGDAVVRPGSDAIAPICHNPLRSQNASAPICLVGMPKSRQTTEMPAAIAAGMARALQRLR